MKLTAVCDPKLGSEISRCIIYEPHLHLWSDCPENVGASTSHNPVGLRGFLQGQLHRTFYIIVNIRLQ
jgi:hypothetical protein